MGQCSVIPKLSLGSSFLGEGDPKLLLLLWAVAGGCLSVSWDAPQDPKFLWLTMIMCQFNREVWLRTPKVHGMELSAVC